MRTFRTITALAGLLLAIAARPQVPCDSLLHASFSATASGSAVAFTNTSWTAHPNGTSFTWSFGDGQQGTGANATHTYANAGTYTACLWAVSENCFDSACTTITVGGLNNPCDGLDAGFQVTAQGPNAHFQNASVSSAVGYVWNFGDGTAGDGPNANHTYAHPGEYHACLKVWAWNPQTQDTCFADHCEWVTIVGDSLNPCEQLNAGFQVTAQGHVAAFSNAVTNNSWAYHWNFGDGSSAFGANPTHTYAQPGQYHACLVTWTWNPQTQDTCFADHCEWVTIVGDSLNPCEQLNAGFQVTAQGHVAAFSNAVTNNSWAYHWNFGDGSSAFGANPTHTYAQPGQYHACLVTWTWNPQTQDTCFADHCEWVTIVGDSLNPCNDLNAGFQVTTQGQVAHFSNPAPNSTWTYEWNFGDGTIGFGPNPEHAYAQPGEYQACLTVWGWNPFTQDSCAADHCEWVTVHGGASPCDSTFFASFTVSLQNGHAVFTGHASQPVSGYSWMFGDGTTGNGTVTDHNYAPGIYQVCMYAWYHPLNSLDTCSALYCHQLVVQGDSVHSPCDGLDAGFQATTQGHVASFTNSTTNNAWVYSWTFGDGTNGYGPNPVHTYAEPGQYHACLTVWSWDPQTQDTCFADHCEWITIEGGGGSPCDSTFSVNYTVSVQGGHAVLTSHASLPATGVYWDLGDGTTAVGPVAEHNYAPGQYTVCVYAWYAPFNSPDSCFAHYCHQLVVEGDTIHNNPCDELNAGFQVTHDGTMAAFTNAAVSNTVTYSWDFGDGTTDLGANPHHMYPGPGQYQACLTVWTWNPQTQDTCFEHHCELVNIAGGAPCDSTWAPTFEWSIANGVVTLWSTTDAGDFNAAQLWRANGVIIGDGEQVTYDPATNDPFMLCLTVNLYNNDQQLMCSGTTCNSIAPNATTGIDESAAGGAISVYPQPFSDRLVVTGKDLNGTVRVMLLDMAGRLVDDRQVNIQGPTALDYAGLPAGSYILRMQGASGEHVVRVMKN